MTDRTAALKAARAKDSNDKRRRVLQTINTMQTAGQPITAAAVATAAGVSTWLVYADGIREHLDAARQRQASDGGPPAATGTHTGQQPVTAAGLRTDLAVARHEIRRLRTDLDKLRGRLRLQLGAEIEQPDRAELIARVAALAYRSNHRRIGARVPGHRRPRRHPTHLSPLTPATGAHHR